MTSFRERLEQLDYSNPDDDTGSLGESEAEHSGGGWILLLAVAGGIVVLWWFWDPITTFVSAVVQFILGLIVLAIAVLVGGFVFVRLVLPWLKDELKRAIGPL